MKKKILAIDQGEHLGGAERFFTEILSRLDSEYEIHLITSKNEQYHKLYMGSLEKIHELDLPSLKPFSLKTYREYRKTQRELKRIIQEICPDLIISNTVRTHLLISPIAKKLKKPLIWMAHDKTFPKKILKWFLCYPRKIIICSRYIKEYFSSTGAKESQMEVVYPFGIDVRIIEELKTVSKKKYVGMVGKFIPWKGQDTFIRAVAALHNQFSDYRFVIVGSAYEGNTESEAYFSSCQKLISELHLGEMVTITNKVQNLMEEMASWELLVHCSNQPEPLGRVILEGMAAGCAVITSRLGGPEEIVEQGETGLLIDPTSNDLEKAMRELLSDEKLRKRLSRQAREHIKEDYEWKGVMKRFKKILLEI
ncbi:MAG: glycosyltransferase family 4 protein [bacterium]|nr:glycosyltransferase family 4 protein [bacterium]